MVMPALANDAFESAVGRCANGFQKSVKPISPQQRFENVIDDKDTRENHQQLKKVGYGDHQLLTSCDSSWDEVYPQLTLIRTLLGSV